VPVRRILYLMQRLDMTQDRQESDERSLGEDLPPIDAYDVQTALDMDSMHILPLAAMPVRTPALKRARLVKNVRLESMVELFKGDDTGSGQVDPRNLPKLLEWSEKRRNPDERLIRTLAKLPSFDVYSLRLQLRKMGVDTSQSDKLKLSDAKAAELTQYLTDFTQPLIRHVYGTVDSDISSVGDLMKMFSSPNREEALNNLRNIASKLGIGLREVPKFLEEYGDVYLSLAYYRDCLDTIIPQILEFEESMKELKANQQLRSDRRLMFCIERISEVTSELTQSVLNRFTEFDRNSADMWENMTAARFNQFKESIRRDHVAIGGILCGLSVKMGGWQNKFKPGSGVVRRAEFIMSDMFQGLDLIGRLEDDEERPAAGETLRATMASLG
jgi:hypothetical protein